MRTDIHSLTHLDYKVITTLITQSESATNSVELAMVQTGYWPFEFFLIWLMASPLSDPPYAFPIWRDQFPNTVLFKSPEIALLVIEAKRSRFICHSFDLNPVFFLGKSPNKGLASHEALHYATCHTLLQKMAPALQ